MPARTENREAILAAARTAWNADPAATLATIASDAGVGRATLHRHFDGRDDLLRVLALQSIHEIDEACEELALVASSATDALRRMIEIVVPLGDRYHFLTRMGELLHDPVIQRETDRELEELAQMVRAAQAEGGLREDLPTAWIVRSCDALIYAAWLAIGEGEVDQDEAAALVVHTLLQGVAAPRRGSAKKKR